MDSITSIPNRIRLECWHEGDWKRKSELAKEQIKTEPSSSVFTIDLLNSDSGGNDGVSQKADSTPQLSGEGANIVAVEVVESTSDGGGDDDDDEL